MKHALRLTAGIFLSGLALGAAGASDEYSMVFGIQLGQPLSIPNCTPNRPVRVACYEPIRSASGKTRFHIKFPDNEHPDWLNDEIVIESVNGGERLTLERQDIEKMHPVAAIVAASKWRPG